MTKLLDSLRLSTTIWLPLLVLFMDSALFGQGLTRVEREAKADQIEREQKIRTSSGMDKWPGSSRLSLAPIVDRGFLSENNLAVDEMRAYDVAVLDKVTCGVMSISWRHLVKSTAPPPAALPTQMIEALQKATAGVSETERQRRLDDALELYRKSKAVVENGAINIKMVLAPSSQTAQEWLVYEATMCALPTEVLVEQFGNAHRVVGIGDVA